ncbi:transposase [Actinomadura sp. 9N215]|uniref:transposase n=1 Tax=Actinomadura sp. 9N215 TaxID=3375150 RepID=UPI003789484D
MLDDNVLDLLLERSKGRGRGLRLTGENSLLGQLVKAMLERALEADLTAHLGYGKHDVAGNGSGNSRNGRGKPKTVQTGVGPVRLDVPRDRAGTFSPVLVPKRSGRVTGGLDDMVISLYAHGMGVCDVQHHLRQVNGTELSHETISRITDQVLAEGRTRSSIFGTVHITASRDNLDQVDPRLRLVAGVGDGAYEGSGTVHIAASRDNLSQVGQHLRLVG